MLPLDPRLFFCLAGSEMPIGSRSQGLRAVNPPIPESSLGCDLPRTCRASRCLSLQIPTGIITRQPMVRAPGRTSEPTAGLSEQRGAPAFGLSQDYEGQSVVSNPVAADRSIAVANRNYS